MGQKLAVLENVNDSILENVNDSKRLLDHIRNDDPSAEGELTAIYLLLSRNPNVAVELYPKVGEREADFRVKAPDEQLWTYVEAFLGTINGRAIGGWKPPPLPGHPISILGRRPMCG